MQQHPGPVPDFLSPAPVSWAVSDEPVAYPAAVRFMEERVAMIRAGTAPEMVWLLEHPSLYTAGTGAQDRDLLDPDRFPVFRASRGGEYTYHGPGQRIAYVMLDLAERSRDIKMFVRTLEEWIIRTVAVFRIRGQRRTGYPGVWVSRPDTPRQDKIAAVGIRCRRWVSFHGISLNVNPDHDCFRGIVPCGISGTDAGVTSLAALGIDEQTQAVDRALESTFRTLFGPVEPVAPPHPGHVPPDPPFRSPGPAR